MIHPTAIVEDGVVLGADCEIRAGAILRRGTILGDRVVVHPYAVLGGEPQDLRFDPATPSGVKIGTGSTIREHATVNRSTKAGGYTELGANCFMMASAHLGHDCVVGANVVIANAVLLAGHVSVGSHCFLGGGAAIHQFCRVGDGVMVGGVARIALDLPPYVMAAERNDVVGLNLIGLRRRGVAPEAVRELKTAFREVYGRPGNIRVIAAELLTHAVSPEAQRFLRFFTEGRRGIARPNRSGLRAEAADAEAGL